MKKKRSKGFTALVVAMCLLFVLVTVGFGIALYLTLRPAESDATDQSTEASSESGEDAPYELYYEDIEEKHVKFDEVTCLQYADNQLLITVADQVKKKDIEKLIVPYQAEIVGEIGLVGVYQLKFPESYTADELRQIGEELCEHAEIETFELNTVMELDVSAAYPNDEKWENEWGDSTPAGLNWGMEAIHAPEAWEHYDDMEEVNVGVYDNMFYDHEDLEFEDILINRHGDDLKNPHGTHVSGTIGATYNNNQGVCGVFPKAKLYGVSFECLESIGANRNWTGIMDKKVAFTYLIDMKKCKVINMSFGWPELAFAASRSNNPIMEKRAKTAIRNNAEKIEKWLQVLLDVNSENDFVICKSAGNDNSNEQFIRADDGDPDANYGYILYDNTDRNRKRRKKYESKKDFKSRIEDAGEECVPAYDCISAIEDKNIRDRILVVGAAENLGNGKYKVADFSDCGYEVDVLGPGVNIYSTVGTNKYEGGKKWSGTSMASPHVAGIAALCFSVNKDLNGLQVADIVRKTAVGSITYTIDNGSQSFGGYPLVDAERAVEKALEMKTESTDWKQDKPDGSRDIALVLDCSGSMDGEPLYETQEAAAKFVDTVFQKDARVSLVTYSDYAEVNCTLTDNQQELKENIGQIYAGGSTNMYAGLSEADALLQGSQADKKIIVLMSDGLPNVGENDYGDYFSPLLRYAEELKNRGYYVYTLGFFSNVDAYSLPYAQQLLEGIASPGLHYEVSDAENLQFFFDDIANQIAGKQYIYIRIACPVDVSVSYEGETLSSKTEEENTRTSFGTLTYEAAEAVQENLDETENPYYGDYGYYESYEESALVEQVKILRLDMDKEYDVEIEGYDSGTMDYIVQFPNENGEYDDVREFPDITVTAFMRATSSTKKTEATYLKVDEDGDGTVDTTYKTEANGEMEEVKDRHLLYVLIGTAAVLLVLALILIIVLICVGRKKDDEGEDSPQYAGYVCGVFGIFNGKRYPLYLGQQCTVGRSSSCNIQLVHGQVSRMHCVIKLLSDGMFEVTDYSANGTYCNNQRLQHGESRRLPDGSLLAIGDADNVLELKRKMIGTAEKGIKR